ncbi:MAG: ABC transporter permease [Planctomycetota bacterium]
MKAEVAIAKREVLRTLRQPAHVGATLLTPLVAWILFSGGLAGAFNGERSSGAALIPGMTLLVVVFGSLYAAITMADDRERAWVQTLTAEGVPAGSIALGKIATGAILATLQALAVLVLTALAVGEAPWPAFHLILLALLLTSLGVGGVSTALACIVRSARAFHGLINLVLMPAWLVSGALFPVKDAAGWVGALTIVNPVAWANTALHDAVFEGVLTPTSVVALIAFAIIGTSLAISAITQGIARRPDGP